MLSIMGQPCCSTTYTVLTFGVRMLQGNDYGDGEGEKSNLAHQGIIQCPFGEDGIKGRNLP